MCVESEILLLLLLLLAVTDIEPNDVSSRPLADKAKTFVNDVENCGCRTPSPFSFLFHFLSVSSSFLEWRDHASCRRRRFNTTTI